MKRISTVLLVAAMSCGMLHAQDNSKGYYKDLFVDGGISLTSRDKLPAAERLGMQEAAVRITNAADRMYLNIVFISLCPPLFYLVRLPNTRFTPATKPMDLG